MVNRHFIPLSRRQRSTMAAKWLLKLTKPSWTRQSRLVRAVAQPY